MNDDARDRQHTWRKWVTWDDYLIDYRPFELMTRQRTTRKNELGEKQDDNQWLQMVCSRARLSAPPLCRCPFSVRRCRSMAFHRSRRGREQRGSEQCTVWHYESRSERYSCLYSLHRGDEVSTEAEAERQYYSTCGSRVGLAPPCSKLTFVAVLTCCRHLPSMKARLKFVSSY